MNTESLLGLAFTQFWQSSLVILLAGFVAWTFFRRRPHWTYALWTLALIKCMTPPVWSSPTGLFSWAAFERTHQTAPELELTMRKVAGPDSLEQPASAIDLHGNMKRGRLSHSPDGHTTVSPVVEASPHAPIVSLPRAIVVAWGLGTATVLLVYGFKIWAMQRSLRRTAQPLAPKLSDLVDRLRARVGTSRQVRLVVSDGPWGPALVGIFRPQLVLPAVLVRERTHDDLTPLVAHELVHLRRGDHLVAVCQLAAQAVWWFHPLVWWLNREMNRSREMSCDEEVLAALDCEPTIYVQALIDIVRLRRQLRGALFSPGMRPVHVTSARLHHLLARGVRFHHRTPAACWPTVALVALMLLPGAGLALSIREPVAKKTYYIDLEPYENRKLDDNQGRGFEGNSLAQLPRGEQTLGGIKFRIGPGLIQLGSKVLGTLPASMDGIKVKERFSKLHILHATCFGISNIGDGTEIGHYLVHYEDQSSERIPIVYGEDVCDWLNTERAKEPSKAKVAWQGNNDFAKSRGCHLRLYASTWTNPKPDERVMRIDFVGHKDQTQAAPVCLAMTAVQE